MGKISSKVRSKKYVDLPCYVVAQNTRTECHFGIVVDKMRTKTAQ
jgi:hypothetical protein